MATANEVVKLAQSWLGIKEGSAEHKMLVDLYNSYLPHPRGYAMKVTDNWCAMFISCLAIKLGITDIIPVECGCGEMIKLFQQLGVWNPDKSRVPNVGDIIFYDWNNDKWSDHVGVVESVAGSIITVIEGNYMDAVNRRTIGVNAMNILGYAVPKYEPEVVESTTKEVYRVRKSWEDAKSQIGAYSVYVNAVNACKEGYYVFDIKGNVVYPKPEPIKTVTVELNQLKKGSTGKQVETLQCILVGRGYYIGEDPIDGSFGNQTDKGVRQFQKDNGLTVDGIVGKETWTCLLA